MKSFKETKKTQSLSLKTEGKHILSHDSQKLIYKLENIVTAVYLVTDFLSPEESLRTQVRNSIQDSLQSIFRSFHTNDHKRQKDLLSETIHYLYETTTYLDILYRTSSISEMNYRILNNEIIQMKKVLEEQIPSEASVDIFSLQDFFSPSVEDKDIQKEQKLSLSKENKANPINKVQEKKAEKVQNMKKEKKIVYRVDSLELVPELKNVKKPSFTAIKKGGEVKSTSTSKTKQLVKSKRHDIIVDILNKKGESSVTDICEHIEGCSSKTIQRDLNEMIRTGVVMKKGDRRWSSYSLK